MMTRPRKSSEESEFAERTSASYRVVPWTSSIEIERSAVSASIVAVWKPVRKSGSVAKVATAIRSSGGLAATNARAAATASSSGCPSIDCELSTARTMLLPRPRFVATRPVTSSPFSVRVGAVTEGSSVTKIARTTG